MEERWARHPGATCMEVFDWAGVDAIEAEELVGRPGPRRDLRPRRHQGLRRRRASGTWSSSTARRRPRRSGSCRCPTSSSWYMERLFPVGRRVNKVVAPVLSRVTTCPSPATSVFAATRRFYDRLDGVREILTDPTTHERAPGGEPRAHGHRRGPPHLHLPLAVRLPGRRGDRQPAAARRRSPTRGSTAWKDAARRAPARPSRRASRRCRCCRRRAGRRRAGRPRPRCAPSPPGSTATLDPAGRAARGRAAARSTRATARRTSSTLELPFADRDDLELGRRGRRAARAGRARTGGPSCCPTRSGGGVSPTRRCDTAD